jgi:hypothetical protein
LTTIRWPNEPGVIPVSRDGEGYSVYDPPLRVHCGKTPPAAADYYSGYRCYYEEGECHVHTEAGLEMDDKDWGLVHSINLPKNADNSVKKATVAGLLGKNGTAGFFPGEPKKAAHLQEIIRRVDAQLLKTVQATFPRYKILGNNNTWRLTQTDPEGMHFDSYGDATDDNHLVRLFVNLDDKPRLWGVGPRVWDVLRKYPDLFRPHRDRHPNQLNKNVNALLPWREVVKHFVAFAPRNLWLVNSQVVAHEIVWGRKMIACSFYVDPATMYRPEMNFATKVRGTLKELYG